MDDRLNFAEIRVLVADGDRYSSGIVGQVLRGFGVQRFLVVGTGADTEKQLNGPAYDLLITECSLPDMKGAELIRWVRQHPRDSVRQMTIILLTGYTRLSDVMEARDAGANSVVRKPVAPATLFDHVAWSARTDRPFIEAVAYTGPCRRFRFGDSGFGLTRRAEDRTNYSDSPQPDGGQNCEQAMEGAST